MIDRSDKLAVVRQCQWLDLSRASVYYTPQPVTESDLALMRRIDEWHLNHPLAGARRLSIGVEKFPWESAEKFPDDW